ncbi:hypothetical protein N865_20780 [Intrasporangium oryzae NRRL B-24470]|uniref:Uncharacterized protein n=1 Tax=Intrasporangium oryzae NRRL B-24470 TaxID=1386089 RepID=W9G1H7_9MICO|nr:FtsQ-type POTRA domain-containing protein [Intrasporangium oryzae]EWS99804.1 hypothetical protein N865_20780 [Intrasporangium oryzae NRRL B-24470]
MTATRSPSRRRGQATGLSSARARFERRAAAARRRPRLVAAGAVVLLLLLGAVAWLGWFSSVLTATSVEVAGVPAAQAAKVRTVAAVPLGGPLMRVDTDAVVRRLEGGREWTAITVSRRLPHTVVVSVTPRVGVLAVRTGGGQIELVDRDGFAFRTVTSAPGGVPLVNAGAAQVTATGVQAALRALATLDTSTRSTISGLTVSSADQVSFTLRVKGSTRTVVWGGVGQEALKARLVTILASEPGSTIDVSVPESPVTR